MCENLGNSAWMAHLSIEGLYWHEKKTHTHKQMTIENKLVFTMNFLWTVLLYDVSNRVNVAHIYRGL